MSAHSHHHSHAHAAEDKPPLPRPFSVLLMSAPARMGLAFMASLLLMALMFWAIGATHG